MGNKFLMAGTQCLGLFRERGKSPSEGVEVFFHALGVFLLEAFAAVQQQTAGGAAGIHLHQFQRTVVAGKGLSQTA